MVLSENMTDQETWQISQYGQILITVIFGSVVVTGLVGNVLVIGLVLLVQHMRTAVNLCLLSLAFTDLIVVVFLPTLPLVYLYGVDESFLGKNFCVFLSSVDRGVLVCSVLTFLLIGVERYTVLCYPLKSLGMWTPTKVSFLLVLIWAIAAGASVPYGYVTVYEQCPKENSTAMCCVVKYSLWFHHYETVLTCVSFFLPIPPLVFLYGKMIITLKTQVPQNDNRCQGIEVAQKARSQVVLMLLILVTLFIVCLLPFHVLYMWYVNDQSSFLAFGYEVTFGLDWGARIVMYINHVANPIVYFLMSANFREAFRAVFCCSSTAQHQLPISGTSLLRR